MQMARTKFTSVESIRANRARRAFGGVGPAQSTAALNLAQTLPAYNQTPKLGRPGPHHAQSARHVVQHQSLHDIQYLVTQFQVNIYSEDAHVDTGGLLNRAEPLHVAHLVHTTVRILMAQLLRFAEPVKHDLVYAHPITIIK